MARPPPIDLDSHLFLRLEEDEGEAVAERLQKTRAHFRSRFFDHQIDVIDDPSPFESVNCPRRSGKTEALAGAIVDPLLQWENAKTFYVTLTLTQAKRNMWELIQKWNKEYNFGAKFHHTEVYARFPRNGLLYLGGAQTERDADRYRGVEGGIDVFVVDEVDSFDKDVLKYLLKDVVIPTLFDKQGKLILGGTPGPVLDGMFWEITDSPAFEITEHKELGLVARSRPWWERNDPKWNKVQFTYSHHHWPMSENKAAPHIWENALRMHQIAGDSDDDPTWQRESLGRWVKDLGALVYKYDEAINAWDPVYTETSPFGLPEGHQWRFLAGVDPGYDDPFSIQVCAWAPTSREFYHVDGFSESGLDIDQAAAKIKELSEKFGGFHTIVADTFGLGKVYFETMRKNHGIVITPRPWREKRDVIEIANTELLAGRAKILRGSDLEKQMRSLKWRDPKRKDLGEHPKQRNDMCDAWVYQTLYSLHHFSKSPKAAPTLAERRKREEEEWFNMAVRRAKSVQEKKLTLRGAADWAVDTFKASLRRHLRDS